VKWIHEIYIKDKNIWCVNLGSNTSWYWKKILKIRDVFAKGYLNGRWTASASGEYTISLGYY